MDNFKNSILLVEFSYSNCISNKNLLKEIYAKYFKTIIFYSDLPNMEGDDEVNFIKINKGYNVHKIFKHFYTKYRQIIDESDGLFYTMDDNIININILNLFKSDKIIYYDCELKTLDNYDGWWWVEQVGKPAINRVINDTEFKKYNITKFCGRPGYGDWFYLPKQYLTDTLFELFELFATYEVFCEIAVPSIINNIALDKSQYQLFTDEILWSNHNRFANKEYIYNSLNHHHNLILHPIKFNANPHIKEWCREFFCKEKCVIIITSNKPTETILKYIKNQEFDVIIVGDNETPDEYKYLNCIYLDTLAQKKLFPDSLSHDCRKKLGNLYANKKGYKEIYEPDYDNIDSIL
jgi:hypothetical protein